ncbi:hypothetical protein C0J52_04326 [Blattella germanica]|nr:hypothetical protein C0J52_04326 [Blattella germanica]
MKGAIAFVFLCLFAITYAQVYPGGVVVENEQPRDILGLPSVGSGLADIGMTVADWGAGVLNAAGRILKK